MSSLYRRDWSATPAAQAYRDLVYRQGWTRWEGRAEAEGRCEVRAFYGKYRLPSGGRSTEAELTRAEKTCRISLQLRRRFPHSDP